MPQYDYQYMDGEKESFVTYQSMSEDPLTEHKGRPCQKTVQRPSVRTDYGSGSNTDPIEMMSIAVDSVEDVQEFRKRNPGVDISDNPNDPKFGIPIARSMNQKYSILDREGYADLKGYRG